MNIADSVKTKVKNTEKKRSYVWFWLIASVINVFGVIIPPDPANKIWHAIGLMASIALVIHYWRADKAQANAKAQQTPADQ